MNNAKKILYLFLALLLPALIFVFLKYAGRNEFNIPVYYIKGVEVPPTDCTQTYGVPYLVPDLPWNFSQHAANVLVFPAEGFDVQRLKKRIDDEFGTGAVRMVDGAVGMSSDSIQLVKNCIFLLNDPSHSVLIDQEDRIRGYYDLRLREEEDRLRVELKILLKKY